jgi:HSP20 family protein
MRSANNKDFLKHVALHLNLFSTVSGGISETNVKIKKYRKGAVINVWAASVTPESFKVLVNNDKLTVYSLLHCDTNPDLSVPMFNQVFELPSEVDISNIDAVYQDGQLQVRLPFYNETIRPKEIDIKQL